MDDDAMDALSLSRPTKTILWGKNQATLAPNLHLPCSVFRTSGAVFTFVLVMRVRVKRCAEPYHCRNIRVKTLERLKALGHTIRVLLRRYHHVK